MPTQRKEINGQLQVIEFSDFTGGINSSVAPQMLAENEYLQIKNFEFDKNKLVTRGGLSEPLSTYEENIKTIFYDDSTNMLLVVLSDKKVFQDNLTDPPVLAGTLTGNSAPHFCRFDGKIFIASGGKLQYFDYNEHSLVTIAASKLCDFVFERFGRLVITHTGDDNLYYSAVGDPYETGWTENTDDDSSSKWLEIGYKDDGDIQKVLPISGDIAIFKTNGRIYSLSGEYPNWTVQMVGDHSDTINADGITDLGSTIVFMTASGLKSLEAVQVYGNFGVNTEFARKFNNSLTGGRVYVPVLKNIHRKRQLLICPDTSDDEGRKQWYCFQYDIGACISFAFTLPITDMVGTTNGVIVASSDSLYRWSREFDTDNGTPINQIIETRELASSRRLYSRMVDVGIRGTHLQPVYLSWANKKLRYLLGDRRNEKHFFSVCRQDTLKIETQAKITIDFIKFYVTEV
ncbi:MAG: hypothetical protein IJ601_04305 [Acidaminococcaceae bacterium]|nr:hypothetical protein [Acidaminococcaceae bacterium]